MSLRPEHLVPLPSPLRADRASLPPHVKAEIETLVGRAPGRFAAQLAVAWLTIVAAAWLAIAAGSFWVSALAVFVIATRQVVLGLLVHEQVHDLAWPCGSWGDLAVNLLAGWPLMVITVDGYAQVHLAITAITSPSATRTSSASTGPTGPCRRRRVVCSGSCSAICSPSTCGR